MTSVMVCGDGYRRGSGPSKDDRGLDIELATGKRNSAGKGVGKGNDIVSAEAIVVLDGLSKGTGPAVIQIENHQARRVDLDCANIRSIAANRIGQAGIVRACLLSLIRTAGLAFVDHGTARQRHHRESGQAKISTTVILQGTQQG